MKYLIGKGYRVHPVNPSIAGQQLLGQTVYGTLDALPAPVDIVDIFRTSEAALAIVSTAIGLEDRLSIGTIWMQLGVRNDTAAEEAESAGLQVVMNRCPKI